jgi:ParB-like chromosome segregation protein Spo0J
MAVQFKVEHSRTSEYRLFPEDIKIRPELNGRHELPDIEPLIASIIEVGQLQPVTIRSDGDKPVLVSGFSRWRAISEINKRKLAPVKMQLRCAYTRCNEVDSVIANISENHFRNSTTMLDDAHNIQRLMTRYALTEEQVAKIYFPTATAPDDEKEAMKFVRKRLKLVTLIPEAEKAVRSGKLKEPAAMAIAKLDEEHQREVMKKSKGGNVKASDIRDAGESAKKAVKQVKAGSNGNNPGMMLAQINAVIESGCFPGIGGKNCEASDDMVHWLAVLIGEDKVRK